MPTGDLIEKTRTKLQERNFTTLLSDRPHSGLYQFFSFDLVNSTQFKASNPNLWPVVVTRFYELVKSELTTRLTSAIVWKYVGDEVLFYKRITARTDLHKLLPAAFDALNATIDLLHKGHPETRELLSVKATAWIAVAEYIQPEDIQKVRLTNRNIIIPTGPLPASLDRDFLGPDIDAGFRISKFSIRNRLIVSAHLAALLYRERGECDGIEKQLRIIGFESLKGVWDGRHYPIIWFEKDWSRIKETFIYDEHLVSEVVAKVKSAHEPGDELELISKIFSDLNKGHEIESLLQTLKAASPASENDLVEIHIPREKYSEVHCVAVCFSSEGKVLVAKRPNTKKRFPSAFEFGCGQLKLGESFGECLLRAYKDDFGVTLKINDAPIPVHSFLITDSEERRTIPGIIFLAEIDNAEHVRAHFSRGKHSEIAWIDPASFKQSAGAQYVPDFLETLAQANAVWKTQKLKK